ncbi:transposase domain-containing protein [Aeromonas caviae]|nr:transposase domain-containing protein [Aeromonas caviae]
MSIQAVSYYSLLETAKANQLEPSAYINYVLRGSVRCPDKIGQSRIKQPEQFSNTSC